MKTNTKNEQVAKAEETSEKAPLRLDVKALRSVMRTSISAGTACMGSKIKWGAAAE